MTAISRFAPDQFPALPALGGLRLSAAEAGVRYRDRLDVMLAEMAEGTTSAGVLTRSQTPGAPVLWCRERLSAGRARALVVNAGNANVATGTAGLEVVRHTAEAAAAAVGCRADDVFVSSTGVIGEPLPGERIVAALPGLHAALRPDAWEDAARAIMTTDTFPKGATRQAAIGGVPVTINGIAKGSGMIAPNMATMLAFVFTDAALPAAVLHALLQRSVPRSFNAITVDSDTSTSDTCLAFATGAGATHPAIADASDPQLDPFDKAFEAVLVDLAKQIARDGEGIQTFVTITVEGARSEEEARDVGLTVANSPLVKTAIAGADPNWGRIVAAVGKAQPPIDPDKLAIWIGDEQAARNGALNPAYREPRAAEHMRGDEVSIRLDLGLGARAATVWTCDLTHAYIDINADYRS